ncbi:MAG: L-lactate dehydrogenase [Deltaproteobacteria bacterium]|jgi:L-lactate dehydrogenase|nr:L-lactate dehydrogenase [Deltaproteobacteria bacterium]
MKANKVAIIGAGHVGSHVGYALAVQGIASDIVYLEIDEPKARSQAMDITDAMSYLRTRTRVRAGNYDDARDADLVVVAAGPLPDRSKGQNRMDTLKLTVDAMQSIVEGLRAIKYNGIILNISNPADVITNFLQQKLNHPTHKILSTSTTLDSARLRRVLSEKLGVDPRSVGAYVLGEHGESQFVAWSAATIAGKPLADYIRENASRLGSIDLAEVASIARNGGWTVMDGKGSTEFGICSAAAEVIRAVFWDERKVLPVSVLLRGQYGQEGVYASLPAVVGLDGVSEIINIPLNPEEQKLMAASCKAIKDNVALAMRL